MARDLGVIIVTLDETGVKHSTDKSSLHHHYLGLYELLFEPYRSGQARILEIGIQFGNSLKTWKDYFPFPEITGIDSVDNGVKIDGVRIIIGDAYTPEMISTVAGPFTLHGREFDIIIDDGSHDEEHQRFVIENYHKLLNQDGILIIEDVQCPIPFLRASLPQDFTYTAIEMVEGNSVVDSKLFICWRK